MSKIVWLSVQILNNFEGIIGTDQLLIKEKKIPPTKGGSLTSTAWVGGACAPPKTTTFFDVAPKLKQMNDIFFFIFKSDLAYILSVMVSVYS